MKGLCQKLLRNTEEEGKTSSDENNIPLMELTKGMREQEYAEAYSPSEGQKPINEVQEQTNDSNVKNLL